MNKIIPASNIPEFARKLESLNKKIVLIGGCFDILHLGHIRFIKKAKGLGDILVVFLESDEMIKRKKGAERPVNPQKIRAEILASLQDINFIILLPKKMENKDYDVKVLQIKPDFIAVTKGDPGLKFKERAAKLVKAKVINAVNFIEGYSTGKIINLVSRGPSF